MAALAAYYPEMVKHLVLISAALADGLAMIFAKLGSHLVIRFLTPVSPIATAIRKR
ncbi:MAG: hypothetical protein ACR2RF_28200 [Geminicoccaceae bacterium]